MYHGVAVLGRQCLGEGCWPLPVMYVVEDDLITIERVDRIV